MLERFVLGTANFSQGYGILGQNTALPQSDVQAILNEASQNSIKFLDTASAYGDISFYAKEIRPFQLISKWRVADDYETTYQTLKHTLARLGQNHFYALLIHDPQNLVYVDKGELASFCRRLKEEGLCQKIGVSIYEEQEWKTYCDLIEPEIVQLPFNPFNQNLNYDVFKQELADKGVEVHARSLFLQGVLLQKSLPDSLKSLENLWRHFLALVPPHQGTHSDSNQRLLAIVTWALSQKWVNKWVVGVASLSNLEDIAKAAQLSDSNEAVAPNFDEFKNMHHSMVDPRNWKVS